MEHYYTNNPTTKSCEQIINSKIFGEDFKFYTDNGVFSKDGVDFGTKVLLENFSSQKEVANVADIGCGYGVISIVLAKQNPGYSFTMVDVNNRSLVLTKKNIELNRIENKVEIIESSSFDNVKGDFDKGYYFYTKPNKQGLIFWFPAVGDRFYGTGINRLIYLYGHYWLAGTPTTWDGFCLILNESHLYIKSPHLRSHGFSVRSAEEKKGL